MAAARPDGQRRLVIADRLLGFARVDQHCAQPGIDPEVAGVPLAGRASGTRPGSRSGPSSAARAPGVAPPTARGTGRSRSPGRVPLRPSRSPGRGHGRASRSGPRPPAAPRPAPTAVGAGRVRRKDQSSSAASSAFRMFEALTRAATTSGSSIDLVEARLAKRLLVLLVGSGEVEPSAMTGVTGQADGVQPGHQLQIASALMPGGAEGRPTRDRPAGPSPAPGRSLASGQDDFRSNSTISRRSCVRGPLRGGPLGFGLPRGRRPIGDQPQSAAEQGRP